MRDSSDTQQLKTTKNKTIKNLDKNTRIQLEATKFITNDPNTQYIQALKEWEDINSENKLSNRIENKEKARVHFKIEDTTPKAEVSETIDNNITESELELNTNIMSQPNKVKENLKKRISTSGINNIKNENAKLIEPNEKFQINDKLFDPKNRAEYLMSKRPKLVTEITESKRKEVLEYLKNRGMEHMIKYGNKTKIKGKYIVILIPISARDNLARGWTETFLFNYMSANPYKCCYSDYEQLFCDNITKQFIFEENTKRQPGNIEIHTDKKLERNPRFIFLINRNLNVKTNSLKNLEQNKLSILQQAEQLDTPNNMSKWFMEGIERIKMELIKQLPITTELYIPVEFILDYEPKYWEELLKTFRNLNNYFKGTEIKFLYIPENIENEKTETKIMNIETKGIYPAMNITGTINGISAVALLDTGAATSCVYLGNAIEANLEILSSKMILKAANNTPLKTCGMVVIPFKINEKILNIKAQCVDNIALKERFIIGMDFLREAKAKIDCGKFKINLEKYGLELEGEKGGGSKLNNIRKYSTSNNRKVKLCENTCLSPDETRIITVCTKNKKILNGKYLFIPNVNWNYYTSDLVVTIENGTSNIIMYNRFKHHITINKNYVIGTLENIKQEHFMVPASKENMNLINLIKSEEERYVNIKDSNSKFEGDELIQYILELTEPNSIGRIFLLSKVMIDKGIYINEIIEEKEQDIIDINEYKNMTDDQYELYLYDQDVKALSETNRYNLAKELLERNLSTNIHKDKLLPLLLKYADTVALSDIDLGEFKLLTATIDYYGPIFNHTPMAVPLKFRDQLDKEIERLLRAKVITESDSLFNNNIIIVPKRNSNSVRITLDSRKLNACSRITRTVLPKISEILFTVGRMKYFSSLDLLAAYWSIYLDKESTGYTAFSLPNGRYEFIRLVMGTSGSSSIFCKCMNIVLDKLLLSDQTKLTERLHVYLDDLFITSTSIDGNLRLLEKVLERFQKHNLKLKIKKCEFLKTNIKFLGHMIDEDGFKPVKDNVLKINSFPTPNSTKDVKSFLGILNYYRNYIPNIATLAEPLYRLTSRVKQFVWSSEANVAFEKLKTVLTGENKLFHPNFDLPFIIRTDSSESVLGGVLSQRSPEGIECPLLFLSKKLTTSEAAWRIADKEMGAVNYCLKILRNLILGYEIHVVVDHFNLINMYSPSLRNARILRMAIAISEFCPTLYFVCGHQNVAADYLSRIFIGDTYTNEETDILAIQTENTINLTLDDLPTQYQSDIFCKNILNGLSNGEERFRQNKNIFILKNGYIFRVVNDLEILLITRQLIVKLIRLTHDDTLNCHPGISQTFEKI